MNEKNSLAEYFSMLLSLNIWIVIS